MRRIRYRVAVSLDGFIAGPNGEADWIPTDPEVDFAAIYAEFDTILVGRTTFEFMQAAGQTILPGMKTVVFSRTMQPPNKKGITMVSDNAAAVVSALKAEPGRDIWLFGGGTLFRNLASDGLVDTVEVTVAPVLLGNGTPLFPQPNRTVGLELKHHRVYPSGLVSLEYDIKR
jgi:dihydrofolate reductase